MSLLGLAVLVLLILQLPPVRAAILTRALAAANERYDLRITAGSLHYNPFTLVVWVDHVRVAARSAPDTPVFEADRALVDLGRSILVGTVHIEEIAITTPRLHLVRMADGRLNLPTLKSSTGPGRTVRIDRVTLRDAAFGFRDTPRSIAFTLDDALVSLSSQPGMPATFSFRTESPGSIRVGGWHSVIDRLRADGTLDGSIFAIRHGAIQTGGTEVAFDGTIDAGARGTGYDLDLRAHGPVTSMLGGLTAPRPLAGRVSFDGALGGPLDAPRVTGIVTSQDFTIDRLAPAALRAEIDYSRRGLRFERVRVQAPWGRVTSSGTVLGPSDAPNDLQVAWAALDADVLPALDVLSSPRTPATIATGSARLRWTAGDQRVSVRGSSELAATRRSGRLPLSGNVGFDVGRSGWQVRHAITLDTFGLRGTIGGAAIETPLGRTPIAGSTSVTASSLAAVERVLSAWGFQDAASALETLDGTADVNVSVEGRLTAPTITADANVPTFTFWKLPGRAASAHVVIRPEGQRFERLTLELGGVRLTSDGLTRQRSGALDGIVRVVSPDPHQWIARFAPTWSGMATAHLDATGTVSGTVSHPELEGNVSAQEVSAAGQHISSLTTWLRVSRQQLEFDRLDARQDSGWLHASGLVTFASGKLDVRGTADAFQLSACDGPRQPGTCAWTLPLAGSVTGTWDLTDLLERPSGRATLDVAGAQWTGIDIGAAHTDARFENGRTTLTLDTPELRAVTSGMVDLAHDGLPFDIDVRAEGTVVRDLAARLGAATAPFTIDGEVAGRAHITGLLKDIRRSRVDATLDPAILTLRRSGASGAQPVTMSIEKAFRLILAPDQVGVDGLSLRLGSSSIIANGLLSHRPGSGATAQLDVAGADLASTITALGLAAPTDGAGRILADVRLTGSPEAPIIQGDLSLIDGAMTFGGERVSKVQVQANVTSGMLTVRGSGSWRDTTAGGSAAVPLMWLTRNLAWWPANWQQVPDRALATTRLAISASPGMLLAERVPRGVPAGGQLDVQIALDADGPAFEHVSGDIRVTSASLTIGNALISQRGEGHATFLHGRVFIAPWLLQGSGTDVTIQGAADIAAGATNLQLSVKGPIGLAPLRPLAGFDMAGTVLTDLSVTGAVSAPVVDGALDLRDVAMRIEAPRLVLSEAHGAILFRDGVAIVDDVSAMANGAPLLVRGSYDVSGRTAPDLSVTAIGVPLQVVANGPRLETDVNLQYTSDSNGPLITGRVEVLPQPYRGSVLAIQNVVEQFQQQFLTRTGRRRRPGRDATPTRLDLEIVSRDDLVVDSNIGRVELQTDLRVAGTVQQPVLLGKIAAVPGGVLRAGGRTYRIERGTITFANPRETQPLVDLIADTRIGSYDITMNVTGSFDALRTSLRSDPPLAESDLRSLLVTGRLVSDTGGRRDLVDEQRVIESLSSDIFGFAAQAIGLDTVSIGVPDLELIAGGIDASTSLNISKAFSREVEVIFSQDLQNDSYSWVAIYRPFRSTSFRLLSRETRDAAVEVRQEHTFGGGAPPRAPIEQTSRRPEPEVSEVLFLGPHGVSDEALLHVIKLRPGDRFNPWEWQSDRDRLSAFYADRGYRQARIRATRTPQGAGMRLEYEIVQGPRTTLAIDGHRFPKDVMAQFDQTWRDALTLEFLVEDLEEVARRHLIDDGYLRPQVRVSTKVNNAEARALLMTVQPGTKVEERRFAFSGHTVLSSDDLEAAVEAAGAARRVWYDPENIVPIVQAAYRARGYLETTVEAGPLEISGTHAELLVGITEGRLFRIARIEFEGADSFTTEQLTQASGLRVGDPLSFPAVRTARQRLQALYIERGFGDAQVRSQARIDRPTASLAPLFTIQEGTRRVIADLQIRGNLHARTKVISDFAELQRGTPVTPVLVSDLQKRLYDTGVFTSVAVDFKPAPLDLGNRADAATARADGEQPVVAVVTVEEAARYSVRYGLQFTRTREATGTEVSYGPGAGADFRDRDFLGRAIAAGIGLRYDRRNQSVQGLLATRRTYGADVRSNLFVTGRREHSGTGTDFSVQDDTMGVTAEQRKRLSPFLELAWAMAYDYRRLSVRRVEGDALLLSFTGDTVGPRVAIAWDSRDNPFDATRGWLHSSAVDFGVRAIGSDVTYARYLLQHFQFVPIGPVVLASGVRFGTLHPFGDPAGANPVSLDLLFTAGGSHSVRGYPEDSLGPPAIADLRLGNRQLLVLNQEVRFPLWRWFKGVAFIDAGNTFPRLSDVSLGDLRLGAGAGLRLATPVGLFRVDLAYPIDPRPQDTTRIYFSVGQAF